MRIDAFPADFAWRLAILGAVNAMLVTIGTRLRQLFLQVDGIPEEDVVEVFPADRAVSRSTKGWEVGVKGTAFSSSTSRTRRFAFQR